MTVKKNLIVLAEFSPSAGMTVIAKVLSPERRGKPRHNGSADENR